MARLLALQMRSLGVCAADVQLQSGGVSRRQQIIACDARRYPSSHELANEIGCARFLHPSFSLLRTLPAQESVQYASEASTAKTIAKFIRRPARLVAQRHAPAGGCGDAAACPLSAWQPLILSAPSARLRPRGGQHLIQRGAGGGDHPRPQARGLGARSAHRPVRGGERAEVRARPPGARALPGQWHFPAGARRQADRRPLQTCREFHEELLGGSSGRSATEAPS